MINERVRLYTSFISVGIVLQYLLWPVVKFPVDEFRTFLTKYTLHYRSVHVFTASLRNTGSIFGIEGGGGNIGDNVANYTVP
jgi:hypothetical protein